MAVGTQNRKDPVDLTHMDRVRDREAQVRGYLGPANYDEQLGKSRDQAEFQFYLDMAQRGFAAAGAAPAPGESPVSTLSRELLSPLAGDAAKITNDMMEQRRVLKAAERLEDRKLKLSALEKVDADKIRADDQAHELAKAGATSSQRRNSIRSAWRKLGGANVREATDLEIDTILAAYAKGGGQDLIDFMARMQRGMDPMMQRGRAPEPIIPDGSGAINKQVNPEPINKQVNPALGDQATYTTADGGKYDGEVGNGLASGQGTYVWANGDTYVGEFKDGKASGQGTYTFADGTKHVGEFSDDILNTAGQPPKGDAGRRDEELYNKYREDGRISGRDWNDLPYLDQEAFLRVHRSVGNETSSSLASGYVLTDAWKKEKEDIAAARGKLKQLDLKDADSFDARARALIAVEALLRSKDLAKTGRWGGGYWAEKGLQFADVAPDLSSVEARRLRRTITDLQASFSLLQESEGGRVSNLQYTELTKLIPKFGQTEDLNRRNLLSLKLKLQGSMTSTLQSKGTFVPDSFYATAEQAGIMDARKWQEDHPWEKTGAAEPGVLREAILSNLGYDNRAPKKDKPAAAGNAAAAKQGGYNPIIVPKKKIGNKPLPDFSKTRNWPHVFSQTGQRGPNGKPITEAESLAARRRFLEREG